MLSAIEHIEVDELKPFRLNNSRRYPTLNTEYGKNMVFSYLPTGLQRVITLAYILIFVWKRYGEYAETLGKEQATHITLLIDEMGCHLPLKWQCQIISLILKMVGCLSPKIEVQLFSTTCSS